MTTRTIEAILLSGSVSDIARAYRSREVSIHEAIDWFVRRVGAYNQAGPALNAVKDLSSTALDEAKALDVELAAGRMRGLLHGIPIFVKDNILIAETYTATAGAAALRAFVPRTTATLVHCLREAGAIILGKTNLTEFADYVSEAMPSEFSGGGGTVRNPHGIRYDRGQGSSVGSAAAVAAGFAPLSIGTETQNSIQTPACYSSVVGFKPSVGAVSRAGIVPLVPSQDSPGPLARTVEDAALVFAAIAGADARDTLTLHAQLPYGRMSPRGLDRIDHVTIGVPRIAMANREQFESVTPQFEAVLRTLSHAGARIVDPCDLPGAEQLQEVRSSVFRTEFKATLNAFLDEHQAPCGIGSLETLIEWNAAHPEHIPYGQSLLIAAQETRGLSDPQYLIDRARDLVLSRTGGIDAALAAANVDVLIAPMGAAAKCTGKAGAPVLAIPAGLDASGTPFGITLFTAYGRDNLLLAIGRLVEAAIGDRRMPAL